MLNRRQALVLPLATAVLGSLRAPARATVAPMKNIIQDSLARHFADNGTAGTFVAYKVEDYTVIASDAGRSGEALLPAATFKIPLAVIALETGVVGDPDKDVFAWDGVTRFIPEWNKDHTLRSAMAASAVPVFQEIARRVGAERMQQSLDAFDYGNRDTSGGIDRFWLTGGLRIDPVQQVDFVDRLRRDALPVSKRAQQLGRDILPETKVGDAVIRSKTGLVGVDDKTEGGGTRASVGWLVGWVEKGDRPTVFALNLDIRVEHHNAARMKLAQACLSEIGAL
ncbi:MULTISPECIES: penicillin-binding transpeptidase domain-containing protein [unclassified Bradyrhizobium]|uniref:penicillin-binding transpeptidase domain-containing protein n=1 Tax=unclassified Bradyrhizobium TaxID=2631580 RepID=UPI002012B10F|nr:MULTISPECIES: penicillin-binding transpeptidase domain-containing protein [unclassified Bradyrhizobium]